MGIFDTSKYNGKQDLYQSIFGLLCAVLMVIGFLQSRALLSIATVALFVNAFWPANITRVFHRFNSSRFGWWALIYLLVYVISIFWSENKEEWSKVIMLKLPFALIPLGMCSLPLERADFRKYLYVAVLLVSSAAVLMSLGRFAMDYEQYIANYTYSMPIPTTIVGDHIRFGLWLALLVMMGFYVMQFEVFAQSKLIRLLSWACIFLFSLYIHILSAKTGLLVLYLVFLGAAFYRLSRRIPTLVAIVVPALLAALSMFLAYRFVPTFKTKINYVLMEVDMIKRGERLNYNLSDQGRLITYDIAWHQMQKGTALGTGAGDIIPVMNEGYDERYPEVPADLRFVPINQFLLEFFAFGWILGLPLILMTLSLVLNKQVQGQFFMNLTVVIFIFSLMVEAMLQIQMGIFLYLFFMMWMLAQKWRQIIPAHAKLSPNSKH